MAGTRSLGVLTLDLVAKIGGFIAGMNAAERETDKRLRGIQKKVSGFGLAIGSALGLSISGAIAGGIATLTSAIDRMDELRDASKRLGVGVETLSAFSYAAQQTGTSIEELGKGLRILAKNAADALNPKGSKYAIFEAINVNVADASGNLRDLDEIMVDVADRFSKLEDGTQKAALAQELFGKSGANLIEFLDQGGKGLEEMTEKARELGLVIDQDAADKADAFNDKLADLKGGVLGLATAVGIDLLDEMTDLTEEMVEFVKEGGDASGVAHEIANGFRDMIAVAKGFGSVISFLDGMVEKINAVQKAMIDGNWLTKARKEFQEQAFGQSGDWDLGGFVENQKRAAGPLASTGIENRFSIPGLTPTQKFDATAPRFTAVGTGNSQIDSARLNAALAGIKPDKPKSGGGASPKKEGKSDAERDAERAKEAVDRLNESYAEQAALFGETSEAAKLRYQFEQESLAELDPATRAYVEQKREEAIVAAERLDQMREEKDVQDELDRVAKQRQEAMDNVLEDIATERQLLGATNEEIDTYNKLKYAGIDANSEWGRSITEANHALHEEADAMADRIAAMDTIRDGVADMAEDIASGTASWESLGDAIDDVAKKLLSMVINNLVEKALGQYGTSSTGSSGGGFWNWAASLFGSAAASSAGGGGGGGFVGPRASGGFSDAWSAFRVNELGPEMATIGGRDYLLTGSEPAYVHNAQDTRAKMGMVVNNAPTIVVQGRVTKATSKQIARDMGIESQRQISRFGAY